MTASAPSLAPDMARYARQSFRAWASLGSDCVVIDTETTGLDAHDEVIEVPISPVLRRWRCAMSAHKAYRGLKRCGKLSEACIVEGVDISDLPDAHGALGDVLRTVRLIRAVAARA